jgi:hypothetical protein
MKIKVLTEHGSIEAEIDEVLNPVTAKAIAQALPIEGVASRWGDEIYFEIPVVVEQENMQVEMEVGDLAYWSTGHAFCIFFGRTPVSDTDKPKAYSGVNKFGKITGKISLLKAVEDGEKVRIESAE